MRSLSLGWYPPSRKRWKSCADGQGAAASGMGGFLPWRSRSRDGVTRCGVHQPGLGLSRPSPAHKGRAATPLPPCALPGVLAPGGKFYLVNSRLSISPVSNEITQRQHSKLYAIKSPSISSKLTQQSVLARPCKGWISQSIPDSLRLIRFL